MKSKTLEYERSLSFMFSNNTRNNKNNDDDMKIIIVTYVTEIL